MPAISANPLAVLKSRAPQRQFTLQEYLQKEEKSLERHAYYNGQIVKLPMAKGPHNIIAANILNCRYAWPYLLRCPHFVMHSNDSLTSYPARMGATGF